MGTKVVRSDHVTEDAGEHDQPKIRPRTKWKKESRDWILSVPEKNGQTAADGAVRKKSRHVGRGGGERVGILMSTRAPFLLLRLRGERDRDRQRQREVERDARLDRGQQRTAIPSSEAEASLAETEELFHPRRDDTSRCHIGTVRLI